MLLSLTLEESCRFKAEKVSTVVPHVSWIVQEGDTIIEIGVTLLKISRVSAIGIKSWTRYALRTIWRWYKKAIRYSEYLVSPAVFFPRKCSVPRWFCARERLSESGN